MPERTATARRALVTLATAILVAGCGATGGGPSSTASAPTPVSAAPTAAPAVTPTPVPVLTPAPIDPGVIAASDPLERIWTASGSPVESLRVGNPSIDPSGRIWALSGADTPFWIFDGDDGHFIEAWGTLGDGDGELDFRRGSDRFGSVAFAPDGTFYVAEAGNHRVQHFSADRTFLAAFGSFGNDDDQFVSPNLLKVDADGNVYVHDDDLGGIKMFRGDGTFVRTFPGLYPFFHVDARGHVFSAEEDKVLREYAPDGSLVRGIDLSGLVEFMSAVVVDDRGRIWIGSNREEGMLAVPDRLLQLDVDGHLVNDWKGIAIDGLVLDPDRGRLYTSFFEPDILVAYAMPAE